MKNKKAGNKQEAKASKIAFTKHAWEDYLSWREENLKILDEINALLEECMRNPFTGTGKPEPLKGELTGYWSRRITQEHRLIYLPEDKAIYVISCRYHY